MNQSRILRPLSQTMLILAVFMLCIQGAHAVEVSNLEFSWAGTQITHLSRNNPIATNLKFTYTTSAGEEIDRLTVNALSMNNDPRKQAEYSNILVPLSSCTGNMCTIANKVIRTSETEIKIIFTIRAKNGTIITSELTKEFQADNTKPKVKSMQSNGCFQNMCYVTNTGPNRITISMEDSIATFSRKKVAFRLGSETGYAVNCSAMTCYGFASPSCSDGQTMTLALAQYNNQQSQDDAGNPIDPYVTTAVCDTLPPVIIEEKAASSSKLDAITTGDSIVLRVNATDTLSPVLNMTIIGDSINSPNTSVTCQKTSQEAGSQFVCTGTIKPAVDVAGEYGLDYYIMDLAGNVESSSVKVNLLLLGNQTSRDLWDVTSVKQSNNRMTKANMLYERTMYIEVALGKKSGSPRIVTLAPDGNTCFPEQDNLTGYKNDITSMTLIKVDKEDNKAYLKLTLRESGTGENNRYAELAQLKYNCPLKITSKEGNYYYSQPEQQNFTIRIGLDDGPTMDSLLKEEAAAVKARVEEKKKITDAYDENLQWVENYCRLCGYTNSISAGLGVVEGGLSALQITKGPATGVGESSNILNTIGLQICEPGIQLCKFMTCDADWQKFLVGNLDSEWMNDIAGYGGYSNFSDSLSPQKSIVVAAATVCLPALNNHIKSLNGIDCHYLECITGGIANSAATLESCQQQKSTSECIWIFGNALDTIPFVSLVRDTFQRLSDIVKDPVALFGMTYPFACKIIPTGTEAHSLCITPIGVISNLNILKTVLNIFHPQGDASSSCGDVSTVNILDLRDWKKVGNYPADHNFTMSTGTGNTVSNPNTGTTVNCDGTTGNCRTPSGRIMILPKLGTNADGETATYGAVFFDTKTNKRYVESDLQDGLIRLSNMQKDILQKRQTALAAERETLIKNPPVQQNPRITEIDKELLDLTQSVTSIETFGKSLNDMKTNGLSLLSFNDKGKAIDEAKLSPEVRALMSEAREQEETYSILKEYGMIDEKGNFIGASKFYSSIQLSASFKQAWKKDLAETYGSGFTKYLTEIENSENDLREFVINSQKTEAKNNMNKQGFEFIEENLDESFQGLTDKDTEKLDKLEKLVDATYNILYYGAGFNPANGELDTMPSKAKIYNNLLSGKTLEDYLEEQHLDSYLDQAEERIDNDIETFADKLQEKLEKMENAQRDAKNAMKAVEYYGSLKATFKTAWGTASGLVSLRGLFNTEWGIWAEHTPLGQASKFFRDASKMEIAMCAEGNIEKTAGVGDGIVLNQVGSKSYRNGAYITGRKSGMTVLPNGDYYYNYWIQGSVSTVKNSGLTFKIMMIDSQGSFEDFTRQITRTDTPIVSTGSPYGFGVSRPYAFNSSKTYDQVCIDFEGQQLSQYFDYVSLTNNRLCQKFMAEE